MRIEKVLTQETASALAFRFFGKTLLVTKDELKSAFRQACKRLHTDSSGTEATKDQFIQMKDLYDQLVGLNPKWVFTDGTEVLKTGSGQLLSELGLGLGPNKNGRDCEHCQHKGYTEETSEPEIRCSYCVFGWTYTPKCRRCEGTGKYKRKSDGREVGTCFTCRGVGHVLIPQGCQCTNCHGTGWLKTGKQRILYVMCWPCRGTGEIEIFNPVIPKGRLR